MSVIGRRLIAQHVFDHSLSMALESLIEAGTDGQDAVIAEFVLVLETLDLVEGEIKVPIRARLRIAVDGRRRVEPRGIDLSLGHEAGIDEIAQDVVGARSSG